MARSNPASIANLKRLIPRIAGKRIGVLGDLMLDRYLWGTASRLSPEAAVPAHAAGPAASADHDANGGGDLGGAVRHRRTDCPVARDQDEVEAEVDD